MNTATAARLAELAARTHPSAELNLATRTDAALYAIVTAVLEAASPPGELALLAAGRDAISVATETERRHHGRSSHSPARPGPAFTRYWHGAARNASPWEDALVERIALGQIWDVLAPRYCRDLEALAEHGTLAAAAASLGTTAATYRVRVSQARAAFRAWWHEHEQPSAMWGSDRRTAGPRARSVTHVIRARSRDRAAAAAGREAAA